MGFQLPNGSEGDARIDWTYTMPLITYEHDAVHRDVMIVGQMYLAGVTGAQNLLIKTPATLEVHLTIGVTSSVGARVQFFEGTVVSADGTAMLASRANRKSTKTITAETFVSPTVTTAGTELAGGYTAGGSGGTASGGSFVHKDAEWVLKAGTNYLIRVTPVASATLSVNLGWYEVSAYGSNAP